MPIMPSRSMDAHCGAALVAHLSLVLALLVLQPNTVLLHSHAGVTTNITVDSALAVYDVNITAERTNFFFCPNGCSTSPVGLQLEAINFTLEGIAIHIYSGIDTAEACFLNPRPAPREVIVKGVKPDNMWQEKGGPPNAIVFHGAFCAGSMILVDRYVGSQRLVLSNVSLLDGATFSVRASTIGTFAVLGHIVLVLNRSTLLVTNSALTGESQDGVNLPPFFPIGWSAELHWTLGGAFVCEVGALLIGNGSMVAIAHATMEDVVRLHLARSAAVGVSEFRRVLRAWIVDATGQQELQEGVGGGGTLLISNNSTLLLDNTTISLDGRYKFASMLAQRQGLVQISFLDDNSRLEVHDGSRALLDACRLQCRVPECTGSDALLVYFQATKNSSMVVDSNSILGVRRSNVTSTRAAVSVTGRQSKGWTAVMAHHSSVGIFGGCRLSNVGVGVSFSAGLADNATLALRNNASLAFYSSATDEAFPLLRGVVFLDFGSVTRGVTMVVDGGSTVGVVDCSAGVFSMSSATSYGVLLNFAGAAQPKLTVAGGSRVGLFGSRVVADNAVLLSWRNVAGGGVVHVSSGGTVGVDASNVAVTQVAVILNAAGSSGCQFLIEGENSQLSIVNNSVVHFPAGTRDVDSSSAVVLQFSTAHLCVVVCRNGGFIGIDTSVLVAMASVGMEDSGALMSTSNGSVVVVLFANATQSQLTVGNRSVLGIKPPVTTDAARVAAQLVRQVREAPSISAASSIVFVDVSGATWCNCTVEDASVLGVVTNAAQDHPEWPPQFINATTTTVAANQSIVQVIMSRSVQSSIFVRGSSALGVVGWNVNGNSSTTPALYRIGSVMPASPCVVCIDMVDANASVLHVLLASLVGVGKNVTVQLATASSTSNRGVVLLNATQSHAASIVVEGAGSLVGVSGSEIASATKTAVSGQWASVLQSALVYLEFAGAGYGSITISNGAMVGVDRLIGLVVMARPAVFLAFAPSVCMQCSVANGSLLGIASSTLSGSNVALLLVRWSDTVGGASTIFNSSVMGIRNTTALTMTSKEVLGVHFRNVSGHTMTLSSDSFIGAEANSTLVRGHPSQTGKGIVVQIDSAMNVTVHVKGGSGIGVRRGTSMECNGPGGMHAVALEMQLCTNAALLIEDGSFLGADADSRLGAQSQSVLLLSLRNITTYGTEGGSSMSFTMPAVVVVRGASMIGARDGSRITGNSMSAGIHIVVERVAGHVAVLLLDGRSVLGVHGRAASIGTTAAPCVQVVVTSSPGANITLHNASVVGSAFGGTMFSNLRSGIQVIIDQASVNSVILLSDQSVWGATGFQSRVMAEQAAISFNCQFTTNMSFVLRTASLLGFDDGTRGYATMEQVLLIDCRSASRPSILVQTDAFIGAVGQSIVSGTNTASALVFINMSMSSGAGLVVRHGGAIGFRGPGCVVDARMGDALRISMAQSNDSMILVADNGSLIGVDGGASVSALLSTVRLECSWTIRANVTIAYGGAVTVSGGGTIATCETGLRVTASNSRELRLLVGTNSMVGIRQGASVLANESAVLWDLSDASNALIEIMDGGFVGIQGNTTAIVAGAVAVEIRASRMRSAVLVIQQSLIGVDGCHGALVSAGTAIVAVVAASSINVALLLIGARDGGVHGIAVSHSRNVSSGRDGVRLHFQTCGDCALRLSNGASVGFVNSGAVVVGLNGVSIVFVGAERCRIVVEDSSLLGISSASDDTREGALAVVHEGPFAYAIGSNAVHVSGIQTIDLVVRIVRASRVGVFARLGFGNGTTAPLSALIVVSLSAQGICVVVISTSQRPSLLVASGARVGVGLETDCDGNAASCCNRTLSASMLSTQEPLLLDFQYSQGAIFVVSGQGTVVGLYVTDGSPSSFIPSCNSSAQSAFNASQGNGHSLAIHSSGASAAVGLQVSRTYNLMFVVNDTALLGIWSGVSTGRCRFHVTSAGYDAVIVDGRWTVSLRFELHNKSMLGVQGPVALTVAATLVRLFVQLADNASLSLADGAVLGVCGTDNVTAGTHGVRLDYIGARHLQIELLRASRVGFFATHSDLCTFHVGKTILAVLLTNTSNATLHVDGGSSIAVDGCGTTEHIRSMEVDDSPGATHDAFLASMAAAGATEPSPFSADGVQLDVSNTVGSSVTVSNHSFVGVSGMCSDDIPGNGSSTVSIYLRCVAVAVAEGPTVFVNLAGSVNSSCTLRNHGAIGLRKGAVAMSVAADVVLITMHNTSFALLEVAENAKIGSCDEDNDGSHNSSSADRRNAAARVLWWYGTGRVLGLSLSGSDDATVSVQGGSHFGIVDLTNYFTSHIHVSVLNGLQAVVQMHSIMARRLTLKIVNRSCVGVGNIRPRVATYEGSWDTVAPPTATTVSFEGPSMPLQRSMRVLWISLTDTLRLSMLLGNASYVGACGVRIAWGATALRPIRIVVQRVNRSIVEVNTTCVLGRAGTAASCIVLVQGASRIGVDGSSALAEDNIPLILCGDRTQQKEPSVAFTSAVFAWHAAHVVVVLNNDSGIQVSRNAMHTLSTVVGIAVNCDFPVALHLLYVATATASNDPAASTAVVQLVGADIRVNGNTVVCDRYDEGLVSAASGFEDVQASFFYVWVHTLQLLSSPRSIFVAVGNSVVVSVHGASFNALPPSPSAAQRTGLVTLYYAQATPLLCGDASLADTACLSLHYACNVWGGYPLLPHDYVPSAFNNATTSVVEEPTLMGIFHEAASMETACIATLSASRGSVSPSVSASACAVVPTPRLRSVSPILDPSLNYQQAPLVYQHTSIWTFPCVAFAVAWLPRTSDAVAALQITVAQLQLLPQSWSKSATLSWTHVPLAANTTVPVNSSEVVVQLCGLTAAMPLYAPTRVFVVEATLRCAAQTFVEGIPVVVHSDSIPLTGETVTVARAATTTAVLSGTLSTGATASRIAALQRLVLCLDPGEEGGGAGGILGFSIGNPQGSFARGAIWGNLMCLGAVVLLCAVATAAASAISHGALSLTMCTELLHTPSIALIAASIVLPSSLSGSVSLIAEYRSASGVGVGDLVLASVGLALCVLHVGVIVWLVFVHLPSHVRLVGRSTLSKPGNAPTPQQHQHQGPQSTWRALVRALDSTMHGAHQWRDVSAAKRSDHGSNRYKRRYHLFIQDARLLWFLALDSMVSCILGVAGGLPALVEVECIVVISIAAAAYASLLAVIVVLRPLNGVFNNIYGALSSFLSLCSLIATAVSVANQHEAAALVGSVAALMMGGVSVLKALLDVLWGLKGVVRVIRRLRQAKPLKHDDSEHGLELGTMLMEPPSPMQGSNSDSFRLSPASDASSIDGDRGSLQSVVHASPAPSVNIDVVPTPIVHKGNANGHQLIDVGHKHGPLDDLLAAYEMHQL